MPEYEACNSFKKETLVQMFSCEFSEISKNTLFTEHLWATASDNLNLTAGIIIIRHLFQFGFTKIVHKIINYNMTN